MTRRWTCGALTAAVLAACHHGGNDGAAVTVSPVIAKTTPPDGATGVEPDAEVTIDLAFPFGGAPAGTVTLTDDANELPGEFEQVGAAKWRWTPRDELPRGNAVVVRSTSQGEVARFTVRDAATRRIYDVPGLVTADAVMVWPNGRSAVHGNARWYEVTAEGLVERFAPFPTDALPHGDGEVVYQEQGTTWDERWVVRSGLAGERDRVRMPSVGGEIDVNAHGDVALFVAANRAEFADRGFWVLRHDSAAWQQVGFYELYLHPSLYEAPTPSIADDGAVSLAYRVQDTGVFVRFAPGDPIAEVRTLPGDAQRHHWAAGDDGSGWVVWDEAEAPSDRVLRGVRYVPGEGFGDVTELRRWTLTASGWTSVACFDACAGRGGSTIVDLTANSPTVPGGPTVRQFLRLERDGWTSLPVPYATSVTARQLVTSAGRAEAWTVRVSDDARELSFARSRPGAQVEVDRTLYAVPEPAFAIGAFHCGLDDAGRMTVAINVVSPGGLAQGLRVVVFE